MEGTPDGVRGDLVVTPADLDALSGAAAASVRRRRHLNLHASFQEPSQRLLNAVRRASYIRPHRHGGVGSRECLIPLRGRFVLLTFDDVGQIRLAVAFGGPGQAALVEIAPHTWHTVVSLSDDGVLFETKSGPFDPAQAKDFAAWAPAEDSPDAPAYLAALSERALRTLDRI